VLMIDPEIHKELFPFDCSNDNCKKRYELEAFLENSDRFGFIFLSNDEYNLFGFTCPNCVTTTVRKYLLNTDILNILYDEEFNYFIPFHSDNIIELCEHDLQCDMFRLPQQIILFHSAWYTKSFLNKCLFTFCEKDISSILNYENLNKKCLFPRIISRRSNYFYTERFMNYVEVEDYLELDHDYVIESITINMKEIAKIFFNPSHESNSGFTPEEYRDLTLKYPSLNYLPPKYDTKTAIHFLKEHKEQRSDFYFQETCMSRLFFKYIKLLYYFKGYFRSKLYFEHKVDYELSFGKEFDFGFKNLTWVDDDPYGHEILTANEVAERWGRDIIIMKSFIMKEELPAYDHKGDWLEIRAPENEGIEIDLQNYVFLKSEVEQLEVLNPWLNLKNQGKKDELKVEQPVQKQRPSTIDKIECQKKAKELWDNAKQNGDRVLSSGEMANHPDIEKIGGNYTKEQRQRWISAVAPEESKKPGVRSKKK